MRIAYQCIIKALLVNLMLVAPAIFAQETTEQKKEPVATEIKKEEVETPVNNTAAKADAKKTQPAKKMVQDATINLQTTITGNQEQPRVLYILPWQSPLTTSVDFEPLDSQQKSVFSHVEREELRRELESAGELQ